MLSPSEVALWTKTLAVALAVGFDVFAISVGVGVAQIAGAARARLGIAFVSAELVMQVLGYALGTAAGHLLGEIATYAGFVLLALIGFLMLWKSLHDSAETKFDATIGVGLLMTALSISLDSLGVGIALPAAGIPLIPLLITLAITTTIFTLVGLEFGARLGVRYERRAEAFAGAMLMVLAVALVIEHLV